MNRRIQKILLSVTLLLFCLEVQAFCGFYVAKADTKLFNKASKVVLVRDAERTVITMSNDFKGDMKEFAIVVPVPVVLQREQINVGAQGDIDHLDAYTAPRLVEYFDADPCSVIMKRKMLDKAMVESAPVMAESESKKLGVTIEASYTIGEYDILILSAKESTGLAVWLRQNDYRLPGGAEKVLGSYIKQDMKFFVAKVNVKQQSKLGFNYLRPLQMAFNSSKFMLPIRLGTLNADGEQELFVFALTRKGRVETTNYRTVKLPSDTEVPVFVKNEFAQFYKDMFSQQVQKHKNKVVFLEYAWDMNWCDPCAADPLSTEQLRRFGAFWIEKQNTRRFKSQARDVYVTRLHLRYTADTFPADLEFQVTGNRSNYQGRYVIRHAWKGDTSRCEAAKNYLDNLKTRQETESRNLADLTGWDLDTIRSKAGLKQAKQSKQGKSWWDELWN